MQGVGSFQLSGSFVHRSHRPRWFGITAVETKMRVGKVQLKVSEMGRLATKVSRPFKYRLNCWMDCD